jgi:hypothetical protein
MMVTAMPDARGTTIAKVPATIIITLSPIDQPVARLIPLFTLIFIFLSLIFDLFAIFPIESLPPARAGRNLSRHQQYFAVDPFRHHLVGFNGVS